MDWLAQHWLELVSLALIAAGVWWLMPQAVPRPKAVGLLVALVGTVLLGIALDAAAGPLDETVLFAAFAVGAILCAVLMITSRNPVYSALWFALSTLGVCGLFLLQLAPFLAAATVIVYAGAIVVTFVFVIMLAQQSGATLYDQRSRQPLGATVASFVLLAAVIGTLQVSNVQVMRGSPDPAQTATDAGSGDPRITPVVAANPLSHPPVDEPLSAIHGLARSLFGDFLLAVELAAMLLLIATIGAAVIAPRRRRGTL